MRARLLTRSETGENIKSFTLAIKPEFDNTATQFGAVTEGSTT